jgi:hypothetical protein
MADPASAQSPQHLEELLDTARFPRVTQFIKDPSVQNALRAFAAAIPWARDPDGRGVRADDDLYLRSIADWTEEILRAHASGCSYYIYSTGVSAGADIDSSPSWFALDELIRCSRPEGAKYRALLQQATAQIDRAGDSAPFAKTGWYDDGRVQSWVFVFGRVAGSTALPDLGDANPLTSPASHSNREEGQQVSREG